MKQHSKYDIDRQANRILYFEDGRLYFSKDTERKIFFVLTVIMLVIGIGYKLGVWR